jgi:hypothetical protein
LGGAGARGILADAIESGAGRAEAVAAVRMQGGGGDPRIVRAVFTVLRESPDLRDDAMAVLTSLARRMRSGDIGNDAVGELVAATHDADADIRLIALVTLGAATPEGGPADPQTVDALLAALTDES